MHELYGPADSKYGSWWDVPAPKFRAYAKMMGPIRARRAIADINAFLYAFGSMKEDRAQQFIFDLQSEAARVSVNAKVEEAYRVKTPREMASAIPDIQVVMEEGPQAKAARKAASSNTTEFA